MKKTMKTVGAILLTLLAVAAAVWFIPRPAGLWYPQERSAGYTGAFEQNSALDGVSYLDLGGYSHPEMALVRDGWIYASVQGGVLLRMREDGSELTKLLDTGGCLLGFAFDGDGDILVLDCDYHGAGAVLRVKNDGSGARTVLLGEETGTALFYPNGIAVARDKTIFISDSSAAFPPAKYGGSSSAAAANEGMMHTCTGRVLALSPGAGKAEVIADGFAFSNGLALSADEKSLFVSETYAYAVKRIDLATGEVRPFLSNLPGFPDNINVGLDGRYWVGFNGERSDGLDGISAKPFLRKCLWIYNKLFSVNESAAIGYCHVFAFTEDGAVTQSLQSAANGYPRSTGAVETDARLYLSSINDAEKLAYVEKASLPNPF